MRLESVARVCGGAGPLKNPLMSLKFLYKTDICFCDRPCAACIFLVVECFSAKKGLVHKSNWHLLSSYMMLCEFKS